MHGNSAWYAHILGTTMNGSEVILVLPTSWDDTAILIARRDDDDEMVSDYIVAAVYAHQFDTARETGSVVRTWDNGNYFHEKEHGDQTYNKALAKALDRALNQKDHLVIAKALVAAL